MPLFLRRAGGVNFVDTSVTPPSESYLPKNAASSAGEAAFLGK